MTIMIRSGWVAGGCVTLAILSLLIGEGGIVGVAFAAPGEHPETTHDEYGQPVLFYDSFESGTMNATNKDGFEWAKNNRTSIVTNEWVVWNNGRTNVPMPEGRTWEAKSGEHALRFRYPAGNAMAEQRFDLGEAYPELWFRFWLRVPHNYQHGPDNPSNGKFFSLWMDGYSNQGTGSTLISGFWRQDDGNTRVSLVGTSTKTAGHDFIRSPEDRGRWMQVVFHIKMSSQPDTEDGEAHLWRRWEGEEKFTKLESFENLDYHPPPNKNKHQGWSAGYLMGWQNAAYEEQTEWMLDDFTVATTSLLEIKEPQALARRQDAGGATR